MPNFRIFVEKSQQFNVEARQLLDNFNSQLHLQLKSLRVINVYDVFNISHSELDKARYVVFGEPTVDEVSYQLELPPPSQWFAIQMLPGQYNQRADSALQALNLLNISSPNLAVTTAKILIFADPLSPEQLQKIQDYYINPLEYELKDLTVLKLDNQLANYNPVPVYHGFTRFSLTHLQQFKKDLGLAMTLADLELIQQYFKNQEARDPSETEIKVLDTYWSDHCRHTTFETELDSIEFVSSKYSEFFQQVFNDYLTSRSKLYSAEKLRTRPLTLMDLATVCGKEFKRDGLLPEMEISAEINACSLIIEVPVNGKIEQWSLQFKNETHNHPTEIEPFGGAATCIGGAIRDPLSGRSYVYQALRISGAANPLVDLKDTLPGKLPQSVITTKAAQGFSSYGNQIGLATTLVREIYHPGYLAKRMEVGMVVAAAPYANIRREEPEAGDVIILVGGRTGRDGCGGATGSSKEHTAHSAALCGAEVQKGNPVTERKIQRLFRNPQVTTLIKKCNDFGAGGVAVAIGELADGIVVDLDAVPTKYNGLTGTELAISESQERMAVVVSAKDAELFMALAHQENLEAVVVATVTNEKRMLLRWHGNPIVNLSREFLNTNGARSHTAVKVTSPSTDYQPLVTIGDKSANFKARMTTLVKDLNIASQQGLGDMFDATIGATTVLMPYGGKYQQTPVQVSVQKLPVINGETTTVSIAAHGFDPYLSSWSPFHGAYFAVVHSVAKIVAAGGSADNIYFSFQEYFERLGNDPQLWGKPFAALLGAYHAQQGFKRAAIGGKDSMSGTFHDLNVPPTLISFALGLGEASQIISPEFKTSGETIYVYFPPASDNQVLDLSQVKADYRQISELIAAREISAAWAVGCGGISEGLALMALGNKIGARLTDSNLDLFKPHYGAQILVGQSQLADKLALVKIGETITEAALISAQGETVTLDELASVWHSKLASVFPLLSDNSLAAQGELIATATHGTSAKYTHSPLAKPRVIIPVFPGSNCEYDSLRAFSTAGALAETLVFNNLSLADIDLSLEHFAGEINNSQILMLPGGFSAGDEPDGSAKFIAAILRNPRISAAIHELLARDGLILGICNGFQALIKSGLLPYGKICELSRESPTLTHNLNGRHISRVVPTVISSNRSPWLSSFKVGEVHQIVMSHGEGRLVVNPTLAQELAANGQIACRYSDLEGNPTFDPYFNPNGSDYAIEALTSVDGRILGKMGHSERYGVDLYKNIPGNKVQDIFANGVKYFR